MQRPAVTMVELLVVMGIFVIISAAVLPMLSFYEGKQAVRSAGIQTEQLLKKAQTRALAGTLGQPWGIYVPNEGHLVVLFAGDEYIEIGNVNPENIGSGAASQTQEGARMPGDVKICMDESMPVDDEGRSIVFPTSAQDNTSTYVELYAGEERRFIIVETSGAITIAETNGQSCHPEEE